MDAQFDAAVAALPETYNQRAVWRRQMRRTDPGLFDERDVPLKPQYLDSIAGTGATIKAESRWLNAVSVVAVACSSVAPPMRRCVPVLSAPELQADAR